MVEWFGYEENFFYVTKMFWALITVYLELVCIFFFVNLTRLIAGQRSSLTTSHTPLSRASSHHLLSKMSTLSRQRCLSLSISYVVSYLCLEYDPAENKPNFELKAKSMNLRFYVFM